MSKQFNLAAAGAVVCVLAACTPSGGDDDLQPLSHKDPRLGPSCALEAWRLDPAWSEFLTGTPLPVPNSEAQVADLSGFGTASVEDEPTIQEPALRLQDAEVRFETATTADRLVLLALPGAGPYQIEVDGPTFPSPTLTGLDQAAFPGVRVFSYEQVFGVDRLYVAGDHTKVAVGGANLYAFMGCGTAGHLFRPPFEDAYGNRAMDGAWYGVELEVIGAADRIVDHFLIQGARHSTLSATADTFSIALVVWEVDSSDPKQGTNVHEQSKTWHATTMTKLPPQPHEYGVEVELEPTTAGLTLETGKRYRFMVQMTASPVSGGLDSTALHFDSFKVDRGSFPSESGAFEITESFREDQKVYPTTTYYTPASNNTERRFPWYGMDTHSAP